jgi:3-oxoacyl-[acyl-carrier protein] reductase
VQGDLTIPQHLERLVQATVGAFGGVDVLVLNGGGPPAGKASTISAAAVEEAVALLLTSHVTLVGRCLPHLRESGRGRIVAIESSSVREPLANLALSNAVRPGVVGWLKTLARELGPDGITVNTIAPGSIDTDRLRSLRGPDGPSAAELESIPLRRLGQASEIAAVVTFLASDRAAYVTGAVIPVDGGLTRSLL